MSTKRCTRCGRELPTTKFRASTKNRDGLTMLCDECLRRNSDRRRKQSEADREKHRLRCQRWRNRNRDYARQYDREFYAANRDRLLAEQKERQSKYREKHPEEWKARRTREHRNSRQKLTDALVRDRLTRGTSLRSRDVPLELVALYREHVKLKRLLRRMHDEEHS